MNVIGLLATAAYLELVMDTEAVCEGWRLCGFIGTGKKSLCHAHFESGSRSRLERGLRMKFASKGVWSGFPPRGFFSVALSNFLEMLDL
jgi:hypothetical protein